MPTTGGIEGVPCGASTETIITPGSGAGINREGWL